MMPATADRLLLCFCWLAYLGVVMVNNGLNSYLAAWQHPLVYAASGVFALLTVVSWWGSAALDQSITASSPQKPADLVLQTLVHCLPVFLIASVGATSLGNQALTTGGFTAARAAATSAPAPASSSASPAATSELTLSDLYTSERPPASATIVAMAYTPTALDRLKLPQEWQHAAIPMLLYRFEIMCCAADASPIYAVVTGIDPQTYPNGTWLRVSGTVTAPKAPINLATITATQVETVPEPLDPYLLRRSTWGFTPAQGP